jgi:uncharacterized protein
VKYLLDANVWLEAILGRVNAAESEALLRTAPAGILAISDFSVYAIGLFVCRTRPDRFASFLGDLVVHHVNTLHLPTPAMLRVLEIHEEFKMDFDDSVQYASAERFDLQIVNFDADFDRTPRGRMTPAQVVAELANDNANDPHQARD